MKGRERQERIVAGCLRGVEAGPVEETKKGLEGGIESVVGIACYRVVLRAATHYH